MRPLKKSITTSLLIFFSLVSFGQNQSDNRLELIFTYKQDKLDTTLFNVEAKIINRTNNSIYFLSESCNGLDYYLNTSSSDFDVYVLLHCNATFPVKNVINPKSEYLFKTTLKMRNEKKKINLKLNLYELDANSMIEGKSVYEIRKEFTSKITTLTAIEK